MVAQYKHKIDKDGDDWSSWRIPGSDMFFGESDFDDILFGPLLISDYQKP